MKVRAYHHDKHEICLTIGDRNTDYRQAKLDVQAFASTYPNAQLAGTVKVYMTATPESSRPAEFAATLRELAEEIEKLGDSYETVLAYLNNATE